MLNQTAVTLMSASGYDSRMLVWTQLSPASQTGQVGDRRRIDRGLPAASLKSAANWSTPSMSGNAANSSGVAPDVHAARTTASAARMIRDRRGMN